MVLPTLDIPNGSLFRETIPGVWHNLAIRYVQDQGLLCLDPVSLLTESVLKAVVAFGGFCPSVTMNCGYFWE